MPQEQVRNETNIGLAQDWFLTCPGQDSKGQKRILPCGKCYDPNLQL